MPELAPPLNSHEGFISATELERSLNCHSHPLYLTRAGYRVSPSTLPAPCRHMVADADVVRLVRYGFGFFGRARETGVVVSSCPRGVFAIAHR